MNAGSKVGVTKTLHVCPTPGKDSYLSRRVAKAAVKRGRWPKSSEIYLCRCGCWHVTKHRHEANVG